MADRDKVLVGRKAVEAYRTAHSALHRKPYYRQIHKDHTPLLEKLINALEGLGFISTETDFELRKSEILAKFFDDSELLNIQELGFVDKEDYIHRGTPEAERAFREMWQ